MIRGGRGSPRCAGAVLALVSTAAAVQVSPIVRGQDVTFVAAGDPGGCTADRRRLQRVGRRSDDRGRPLAAATRCTSRSIPAARIQVPDCLSQPLRSRSGKSAHGTGARRTAADPNCGCPAIGRRRRCQRPRLRGTIEEVGYTSRSGPAAADSQSTCRPRSSAPH